jgi:GTPase
LGPDDSGNFANVRIVDIHRNRRPARLVRAGQLATFALDTRVPLRRGQVLVAEGGRPKVCSAFSAQVLLLRAASTLAVDREVRSNMWRGMYPLAKMMDLSHLFEFHLSWSP